SRNLRQRADGRWEWKHALGRRMREVDLDSGEWDWRAQFEGMGDDARAIQCPVLVLRGSESDVLSDAGAEEGVELIPEARLRRGAEVGHVEAGDKPGGAVARFRAFRGQLGWWTARQQVALGAGG